MLTLTISIGVLLVALGLAGYVMSDMVSLTALIPAAFGVVLVLLAAMARVEARRKTAMHIAMGVALLGIAGSIGGLMEVIAAMTREGGGFRVAALSRATMAVLLLAYLAAGVRSFIAARRG